MEKVEQAHVAIKYWSDDSCTVAYAVENLEHLCAIEGFLEEQGVYDGGWAMASAHGGIWAAAFHLAQVPKELIEMGVDRLSKKVQVKHSIQRPEMGTPDLYVNTGSDPIPLKVFPTPSLGDYARGASDALAIMLGRQRNAAGAHIDLTSFSEYILNREKGKVPWIKPSI